MKIIQKIKISQNIQKIDSSLKQKIEDSVRRVKSGHFVVYNKKQFVKDFLSKYKISV